MSWRLIQAGMLVLSAVAVAACSRGLPAPVEYRSAASAPPARSAETPQRVPVPKARPATAKPNTTIDAKPPQQTAALIQPGVYVVRPGDGLFAISQRSQVALRDLIDANGLQPPYHLNAGQSLTIPAVRYHVVAPGDTVTSIANSRSVSTRALMIANDIEPPFVIRVGDRLRLPAPMQEETETLVATAAAPSAVKVPWSAPSIEPQARVARPVVPGPGETPRPAGRPLGRGDVPPLPASKPGAKLVHAEPAPAVIPQPPQRAGGRFSWPVRGRVISGFGPKSGGFYNDGINIAVRSGTAVKAAENGVVTYVGNELRGFGNLVLIRHQGGWVTAYAHVSEISVKPGQIVRRGKTIARAGQSGRVSRPQLHFEIRRGRRAVNPLNHLPKQRSAATVADIGDVLSAAYSRDLPSRPARS